MALSSEVIDSINRQLEKFGDDDRAFEGWMDTITPHVRAHSDVGAFRTQARALWLSNNKRGVRKLVHDTLSQPTRDEQEALKTGELTGALFSDTYVQFLARMGIHKGDTLSVHGTDGQLHSLTFDVEGLPARAPAHAPAPAPAREATLLTEPAPQPKAEVLAEKPAEEKTKAPTEKATTKKKTTRKRATRKKATSE